MPAMFCKTHVSSPLRPVGTDLKAPSRWYCTDCAVEDRPCYYVILNDAVLIAEPNTLFHAPFAKRSAAVNGGESDRG